MSNLLDIGNPLRDLFDRVSILRSAGVQPQLNGLLPFVLTASEFRDLITHPENGVFVLSMCVVKPDIIGASGYIVDNYTDSAIYVMEPWAETKSNLYARMQAIGTLIGDTDAVDHIVSLLKSCELTDDEAKRIVAIVRGRARLPKIG